MKLSEIKGERTIDVIAEIIEPISNIAQDKECYGDLFGRITPPPDLQAEEVKKYAVKTMTKKIRKYAPKILKAHKSDIISIFATIEGVDREEYTNSLTLPKLITSLLELMTDQMFTELFTSAQT